MLIPLFFLTCTIAILFLIISSRIKINWVKKSFIIYGMIFAFTTFGIGTTFVFENKTWIKTTFQEIVPMKEEKYYYPPETLMSEYSIKSAVHLDAPMIEQLPELPRGCEVTSLAMLLQYHDINVDKMELATKIKKDPTSYQETEHGIQFGNPNNGFVGDMYTYDNPGLGVYHKPIAALTATYAGKGVNDFTGGDFSEIITHLNQDRPVWVIINTAYKELPDNEFTTWYTSDGPIEITMKEHSVLVTGYDDESIYFNDPLNRTNKAPYEDFKAAWIQMGKQAITIESS